MLKSLRQRLERLEAVRGAGVARISWRLGSPHAVIKLADGRTQEVPPEQLPAMLRGLRVEVRHHVRVAGAA